MKTGVPVRRDVPKLVNMTFLRANNSSCVVLEMLHDIDTAIILATGLLNGNEQLFRVTKAAQPEFFVYYADGHTAAWTYEDKQPKEGSEPPLCGGSKTWTAMSADKAAEIADMLLDCIEKDYGIPCRC